MGLVQAFAWPSFAMFGANCSNSGVSPTTLIMLTFSTTKVARPGSVDAYALDTGFGTWSA
jgi:hypothetical protein